MVVDVFFVFSSRLVVVSLDIFFLVIATEPESLSVLVDFVLLREIVLVVLLC